MTAATQRDQPHKTLTRPSRTSPTWCRAAHPFDTIDHIHRAGSHRSIPKLPPRRSPAENRLGREVIVESGDQSEHLNHLPPNRTIVDAGRRRDPGGRRSRDSRRRPAVLPARRHSRRPHRRCYESVQGITSRVGVNRAPEPTAGVYCPSQFEGFGPPDFPDDYPVGPHRQTTLTRSRRLTSPLPSRAGGRDS